MKRKIESDEDEDVPLSTRKKSKKVAPSLKTKKKKRKRADDEDSDAEPEETQVIHFFFYMFPNLNVDRRIVCFVPRSFCRNQRRRIREKQKAIVRGRRSKRSSRKFGNEIGRAHV